MAGVHQRRSAVRGVLLGQGPLEHQRQQPAVFHSGCAHTEARNPLFERLTEMEVQMHRTPATTPAGIAVKLRMWARLHGHHFEGNWWERSVEDFGHDLDVVPIIGALHDAERLAGRAQL